MSLTNTHVQHPLIDDILKARYYKRSKTGEVMESWEQLCSRVAATVANQECNTADYTEMYKKTFDLLNSGTFLPNSPTLMGAGMKGYTLSACFAIPIEDDTEQIFTALKHAALITKSGGGVGASFSACRPANARVSLRGGVASGPVSFMSLFDRMVDVMKQGGVRRGAQLSTMHCAHPDIMEFINAKADAVSLCNMNTSVSLTDDFMKKALAGEDWELRFNEYKETINAADLLNEIAKNAWETGDPGALFIDTIQNDNTIPGVKIKTSNPCWTGDTEVWTIDGPKTFKELAETGEDVLVLTNVDGRLDYRMMRNPRKTGTVKELYGIVFTDGTSVKCTTNHKVILRDGRKKYVRDLKVGNIIESIYWYLDVKRIKSIVYIETEGTDVYNGTVNETHTYYIHTYDNDGILSANCGEACLRPYEACTLGSINLNNMITDGNFDFEKFADTIKTAMRILDNIIDANWFPVSQIEKMVKKYRAVGLGIMGLADVFIRMGYVYGSPESIDLFKLIMATLRKNTLQASIDLGIERGSFPEFRKSIYRGIYPAMRHASHTSIAPTGSIALIAGCSHGIEPYYSFKPQTREISGMGEVTMPSAWSHLKGTPDEKLLVTAKEIPWQQHIEIQSLAQKFLEGGAVSKTINLPHNATVEDVREIFITAWKQGCKGITVFRDGCKKAGLYTEPCPECKKGKMVWHAGCHLCDACGFSDKCSAG